MIASLGTYNPDGILVRVNIWFAIVDNKIYIASINPSKKNINIRKNPNVVIEAKFGNRKVIINGKAKIIASTDPSFNVYAQHIASKYQRYFGPPRLALNEIKQNRILIEIEPIKIKMIES